MAGGMPDATSLASDVVVSGVSSAPVSSMADQSVLGYFWNAGLLIKLVMLSLLACSIWSWAVIITKYLKLRKLAADADYFEGDFWSGTPLEKLYKELKDAVFDPMSNIFCAAMAEWNNFADKHSGGEPQATKALEQRVERAMAITIRREIDELEKGLPFLASLGTNGVIIGLFGTVVGILNGFKVLALQQNASISAVAPVISEALFTTAMGIFVAIPAALAYNKLSASVERYVTRLETFADEFSAIISRQFDER
ncbi:MAG: protein TolQ [Alphaproteobacteria bacterium]|nr:protein TolQ [Alphaproteobacteria bacterium]